MPSLPTHAELYSPSGSHRWMHCAGTFRICAGLPPKPPTIYALEGSAAHLLGERSLKNHLDPRDKVDFPLEYVQDDGTVYHTIVTDEMAVAVALYVDTVNFMRELASNPIVLIEERLDLSWIVEGFFGTGDFVLIDPDRLLSVVDYKHGAGVPVDVEGNPQLLIYGLGALGEDNKYNVKDVHLTIIQPRAPHPHGPIREWHISVDYLRAWEKEVLRPAVARTQDPNAQLTPGDWCRWCPGLDVCPAMLDEINRRVELAFGPKELVTIESEPLLPPEQTTAAQLDWMLNFGKVFNEYLSRMQEEAKRRLENKLPNAPKDWKLVTGKTARTWKDEAALAIYLKQFKGITAYTEAVIKSPAQLEKEFKLHKLDIKPLAEFLVRQPGNPSLVHASDKRPEIAPTVDMMFGDDDILKI